MLETIIKFMRFIIRNFEAKSLKQELIKKNKADVFYQTNSHIIFRCVQNNSESIKIRDDGVQLCEYHLTVDCKRF